VIACSRAALAPGSGAHAWGCSDVVASTERIAGCPPGAPETASYILFMQTEQAVKGFSDVDLLRSLHDIVGRSRWAEADVIAHISEFDARGLYRAEAASSMFVYCTERLNFSEAEAYLRIAAARATRRCPALLDMLREGQLNLSTLIKIAPHLTAENEAEVLARAAFRSKGEIEELIAALAPRPDVGPSMRKLPDKTEPTPRPVPSVELRPDDAPG
jgi:hypothetical protein